MNRLLLEQLKRQLHSGDLRPEDLRQRLLRAIDEQVRQGAEHMDTALVLACEELLWELDAGQPVPASAPAKLAGYRRLTDSLRARRARPTGISLRTAALATAGTLAMAAALYFTLPRVEPQALPTSAASHGTPLPLREPLVTASTGPVLITMAPTEVPTPALTPTPVPTAAPVTPAPTATPVPGPKYVTMQELRSSAPARWQHTFEVQGRVSQMDAPVVIPAVDRMPVPEIKWLAFDEAAIGAAIQAAAPSNGLTIHMNEGAPYVNILAKAQNDSYLNGPKRGSARTIPLPNQPAANSAYTPQQAWALMERLLQAAGIDIARVEQVGVTGTTGFYPYQSATPQQREAQPYAYLDQSAPVQGFEQGFYYVSARQVIDGVPLLPYEYLYSSTPDSPYQVEGILRMRAVDDEDYELDIKALQPVGVKVADLPLANMDRVLGTLSALGESGRLRRVDRIELGYMLYYEQHVKAGPEEKDATLVALPVWQVTGYLAPDVSYDPGVHLEEMMNEAVTRTYLEDSLDFRIDAQTGLLMERHSTLPIKGNPLILTWEQMEGEEDVSLLP